MAATEPPCSEGKKKELQTGGTTLLLQCIPEKRRVLFRPALFVELAGTFLNEIAAGDRVVIFKLAAIETNGVQTCPAARRVERSKISRSG